MKVNTTNGFSLIEFLVYFCLSSFLLVISMHTIVTFEKNIIVQQKNALCEVSLASCLDGFARICRSAPWGRKNWHCIENNKIAWSTDEGITEFLLDNRRLMHVVRTKDRSGQLHAPGYSVLLSSIEGSFSVDSTSDMITCVHLTGTVTTPSNTIHIKQDVPLALGYGL